MRAHIGTCSTTNHSATHAFTIAVNVVEVWMETSIAWRRSASSLEWAMDGGRQEGQGSQHHYLVSARRWHRRDWRSGSRVHPKVGTRMKFCMPELSVL